MLGRRVASALAAALLVPAARQPSCASSGGAGTRAVAIIAGGFLIPAEQYLSYRTGLEALGCTAVICADPSTLSSPLSPNECGRAAIEASEALASNVGLSNDAPLFLVGHSRGAKACVAAASLSRRRVAGMVLLDPVDATSKDPSSVLATLSSLPGVPTAILGSQYGPVDGCAPPGANYESFASALDGSSSDRLVGKLSRTGHTQFLDERRSLLVDVCTPGKDSDASVREVALATVTAWLDTYCADTITNTMGSSATNRKAIVVDQIAVHALRGRQFAAAVEWL
jgi:pimeloyl-ACP methyl ester carboxylesterase